MNHRPDTKLQVLWNRLLAVVEEQGQALIRTAPTSGSVPVSLRLIFPF